MRARPMLALAASIAICTAAPARADEGQTGHYGGWIALADLSALGVGGLAAATQSAPLGVIAGAAYLIGGPIIHWRHDHGGRAAGSLALRILLPTAVGAVGWASGWVSQSGKGGEDKLLGQAIGAGIGAGVGAMAGMIVDAAVLARGPEASPPQARMALVVLPPANGNRTGLALRASF